MGNDDGSINFLSIKDVKARQTLHACQSPIFEIMELDHSTVIVIGKTGDMTLIYTESEYDPSGDTISFNMTAFPSLNHTVTYVARCELDPE